MSNARNLAKVAVDANGDIGTASLDNLTGALGYTPVDKAGDTMTGNLIVNANVGVGTSSPLAFTKLEVKGTAGTQIGANQQLVVSAPSDTVGEGAGIRLNAAGAVGSAKEAVAILGVVNESSGNNGAMTFHVYDGGGNIPEQMRIDSAGRVTMPYQPSFHFVKSTGAVTSVGSTILWDYDRGNVGGHYSTTTGRFTAPVSGVYFFCAAAIANQANTCRLLIKKNNVGYSDMRNGESPTVAMSNYEGLTAIAIMPMSAGDYAHVVLDEGQMYGGNNVHSYFCGYLIG